MSIAQTTSSETISFRSSERASGGWFYSGMAIAAILTSVAGFAPSLIGTAGRNAPVTPVAAAHGMISFAWLLVFLAQTMLIRTGRITAHRSLGTTSAALAAAVIALGYVTSIAMARRGFDLSGDLAVRPDPLASLGFPLLDTLMFAVLFVAGVVYRRRPAIHKRLMLLSRCTQFPEYDLKGCFAALKSRNSPNCLYSNPGQKPMHGKRMVSSLCLYPEQTSAGTSSGF
jgi:hypothetical protein